MSYTKIIFELAPFNGVFHSPEYKEAVEKLSQYRRFIGLGAGRMGYSLRAFMMRLSHMGMDAYMIGDTNVPRCAPNVPCIVNSSSGNTPSLLLFAEQARDHGSPVILFTSDRGSRLAGIADLTVCYGKHPSEQVMKTIYEQFTFLMFDQLAEDIRSKLGISREFMEGNHSILE